MAVEAAHETRRYIIGQDVPGGNAGIFRRESVCGTFGIPQPTTFFYASRRCAQRRPVSLQTCQPMTLASLAAISFHQGADTAWSPQVVDKRRVIAGNSDDIQPQHLFIRDIGNQLTDRMPDDIFARR